MTAKDAMLYAAGWAILTLPGLAVSILLIRRWRARTAEANRAFRFSVVEMLAAAALAAPGAYVAAAESVFLGVELAAYLLLGGALGWSWARYRAGGVPVTPAKSAGWMAGGILLLLAVGALAGGLLCAVFYLLHEGFFR